MEDLFKLKQFINVWPVSPTHIMEKSHQVINFIQLEVSQFSI